MSLRQQAAVMALVEASDDLRGVSRQRTADLLETLGSPDPLVAGRLTGLEVIDQDLAAALMEALGSESVDRWEEELAQILSGDPTCGLVTVCDDGYPINLRQIYDKPPFLFYRGRLDPAEERAVAVVGTRNPSPAGLEQARRLAAGLADAGVLVVSGLAKGIDGAAHTSAIEAGGRTIAVLGHGILSPTYPKVNAGLAERIVTADLGAIVSQFWPTAPPTRQTFPMRNVVTSGLSLGTVVVEAGETSGARQQARKCLEHGKQLFLVRDLVTHQEWARRYAERPGTVVVQDVVEVLDRLDALVPQPEPVQLTLGA